MKPFNLEAALRGDPVVTRGGKKATQITKFYKEDATIACVIDNSLFLFFEDGMFTNNGSESCHDLFMDERTIRIGDVEVPEPVRHVLKNGEYYWVANADAREVTQYKWYSDTADFLFLRRGLIHRTKEAAKSHADALIKISGGTP